MFRLITSLFMSLTLKVRYFSILIFGLLPFLLLNIKQLNSNHLEPTFSLNTGNELLGLTIVAIVWGIYITWGAYNATSEEIRQLQQAVLNIGAIKIKPSAGYPSADDKIKQLKHAINRVDSRYLQSLDLVSAATDEVCDAANQLVTIAKDGAESFKIQSQAIDSIVTSIEQTSKNVNTAANNAQQVNHIAQHTHQLSANGKCVVHKVLNEIHRIADTTKKASHAVGTLSQRSQQIGNIILTIESISEQTSLLALNAAIESARAGDHGRGFSVVASEVRSLADRSRESTTEISKLITSIGSEIGDIVTNMDAVNQSVTNSVEQAENASDALGEIENQANQNYSMTMEICSALEGQSQAVNLISESIDKVNIMAQDHNKTTISTASTAEYLLVLSNRLQAVANSSD